MSCKACVHPQRDTIDRQLIAGTPLRHIVASTGLSLGGLSRHRTHLKQMMGDALKDRDESERSEHGHALIHRAEGLLDEAQGILRSAKARADLRAATGAVLACVRILELIGKADGTLTTPNAGGIHLSMTRVTNISMGADDDISFAVMIGEATGGFSVDELMRLKALAENATSVQPAHNRPSNLLNP